MDNTTIIKDVYYKEQFRYNLKYTYNKLIDFLNAEKSEKLNSKKC